jgi:LysM repeat protein
MSRFKIIVFLMAVGVLAAILASAWWYYVHVFAPDAEVESGLHKMQQTKGAAPPDPGLKRFEKAVELISNNDLENGRAALYELIRTFPESTRVAESKRIIGEINMDMLFSADMNPLRKDYVVQPGDSLGLIARKQQTTIECVLRANGMQSSILQPGDHLNVFPLDFSMVIDISAKTVTILRSDRFFREYVALDVKLPENAKAPFEAKIVDKPAIGEDGKRVGALSPEFMTADKSLSAEKVDKSTYKTNFSIRALPKAKPVGEAAAARPPAKGKSAKGKAKGSGGDDADPEPAPVVPLTGIFLPREDIEEIFTIIRTQTPVKVVR